jgi:hypothetical protein
MVTNACPNHAGAYQYGGITDSKIPAATADCQSYSVPQSAYVGPKAIPLRSGIGLTLTGGEIIYAALDAGFYLGQTCTAARGACMPGSDAVMCSYIMEKYCGTANLMGNTTATMHMFLSDCGGHASYHNHITLACEYSAAATGHSALVAIMLDGRGMYGMYETTATVPTNLDACNGHYGPVPAISFVSSATKMNHCHCVIQHTKGHRKQGWVWGQET